MVLDKHAIAASFSQKMGKEVLLGSCLRKTDGCLCSSVAILVTFKTGKSNSKSSVAQGVL